MKKYIKKTIVQAIKLNIITRNTSTVDYAVIAVLKISDFRQLSLGDMEFSEAYIQVVEASKSALRSK